MEIKPVPGIDVIKNTINIAEVVLTGASGKTYRPTKKLAAGRLAAWEASWFKAKHGMTAKDLLTHLFEMEKWAKINDMYEISVKIHYLKDPTARIADMLTNPILELLAYFVNTQDEDISEIDDNQISEKVHDLRYFDTDGLFILAGTLMPALLRDYIENNIDISLIMEIAKKMQIKNLQNENAQSDAVK